MLLKIVLLALAAVSPVLSAPVLPRELAQRHEPALAARYDAFSPGAPHHKVARQDDGGDEPPPEDGGGDDAPPDDGGGDDTPPDDGGGDDTPPDDGGGDDAPPDDGGGDDAPPDDGEGVVDDGGDGGGDDGATK